ncbi:MAG: CatB-related O-acetyltransferase [Proteobacteria bacterium]|nr:CatB-related O-acetyltransferase [Pseudomonadota bacterium]
MPRLPDAHSHYPLVQPDGAEHRQMANLAVAVDHPNWQVGRNAYANDFDPPEDWAARLAPYLYPGAPECLLIGAFCQIAHGARFITASANHPMGGLSTYPFDVFDPENRAGFLESIGRLPDTVIGPDCWIGHGALILPGARLGPGVIVGAGAVVAEEVPAYAIVAGNPARVLRRRFPEDAIAMLLDLAWWDWPDAAIARAIPHLASGDITALAREKPA